MLLREIKVSKQLKFYVTYLIGGEDEESGNCPRFALIAFNTD
jgi:hypothetical protein